MVLIPSQLQPPRLDAEADFLASTEPSGTKGTVKALAQVKISLCAKNTGGAGGFAIWQASEARGL